MNLANKFRPKKLSDVSGQDVIVKSLENAFNRKKLSHTILLTGNYGCGKTTSARILAAMLNCENKDNSDPCGECDSCKKIFNETAIDIREIDAASHRGIDDIRSIQDKAKYAPAELKYKIYIIDECHSLTIQAMEAFLKMLEEPLSHVYFFLCTTEPQKLKNTILSRCQIYTFKKITNNQIFKRLLEICDHESIEIEEDALRLIVKLSKGSMRDAIRDLEFLRNYSDDKCTVKDTIELFGVVDKDFAYNILDKIINKNVTESILIINEMINKGVSSNTMLSEINEHFRNIMILQTCNDSSVIEVSDVNLEKFRKQSKEISIKILFDISHIFQKTQALINYNLSAQYILEQALIESVILMYTEKNKEKGDKK